MKFSSTEQNRARFVQTQNFQPQVFMNGISLILFPTGTIC